jgi:hypothetical protein
MRNVLYHFTTKSNLKKIIKTNCLKISEKCGLHAVSLTRDKYLLRKCAYLKGHNCNVMMVLDRDKLKCNYRLEPIDFFGSLPMNTKIYKEAEEVIKLDITDLSKYILEVVYFD